VSLAADIDSRIRRSRCDDGYGFNAIPRESPRRKLRGGEFGAGDELAISLNKQKRKSQIRMVAGFAQVIEREESLGA
jgi:hypothetical protein